MDPFPSLPTLKRLVFTKEKLDAQRLRMFVECLKIKRCWESCVWDHLFVLLLASLVGQDEAGNAAIPGIPDDLVQKWYSEDVFKKFHESLTEVFGAYDPTATPTKRTQPVQEGTPDEPSRKRGRVVGPESICKPEALSGQEISKAGAGEGPDSSSFFMC